MELVYILPFVMAQFDVFSLYQHHVHNNEQMSDTVIETVSDYSNP